MKDIIEVRLKSLEKVVDSQKERRPAPAQGLGRATKIVLNYIVGEESLFNLMLWRNYVRSS